MSRSSLRQRSVARAGSVPSAASLGLAELAAEQPVMQSRAAVGPGRERLVRGAVVGGDKEASRREVVREPPVERDVAFARKDPVDVDPPGVTGVVAEAR